VKCCSCVSRYFWKWCHCNIHLLFFTKYFQRVSESTTVHPFRLEKSVFKKVQSHQYCSGIKNVSRNDSQKGPVTATPTCSQSIHIFGVKFTPARGCASQMFKQLSRQQLAYILGSCKALVYFQSPIRIQFYQSINTGSS
jgi:hypothetical protein